MSGEVVRTCTRCARLREREQETTARLLVAQQGIDVDAALAAAEAAQIAVGALQIHIERHHQPGWAPDGAILDAYPWAAGDCTTCDAVGVPVTDLGAYYSRYAHAPRPLVVCTRCTLRIELRRRGLDATADAG